MTVASDLSLEEIRQDLSQSIKSANLLSMRLVVIQMLVSAYLAHDLDEESFLADINQIVPRYKELHAPKSWHSILPSPIGEKMLEIVRQMETTILFEAAWCRRDCDRRRNSAVARRALGQKLIEMDQRLARMHREIIDTLSSLN